MTLYTDAIRIVISLSPGPSSTPKSLSFFLLECHKKYPNNSVLFPPKKVIGKARNIMVQIKFYNVVDKSNAVSTFTLGNKKASLLIIEKKKELIRLSLGLHAKKVFRGMQAFLLHHHYQSGTVDYKSTFIFAQSATFVSRKKNICSVNSGGDKI